MKGARASLHLMTLIGLFTVQTQATVLQATLHFRSLHEERKLSILACRSRDEHHDGRRLKSPDDTQLSCFTHIFLLK